MERRVDYATMAPGVRAALLGLEPYVHQSGLERPLVELFDLRASLINGCAHCADIHTKVARLTLAIVAINGWNRLAIAFRTAPGTFEIGARASAEGAPTHAHH